jgi:DNA processing protein
MSEACSACKRRAWLLGRLGVPLDFRARDLPGFWRLLALDDEDLIAAVGGRRREELAEEYGRWKPTPTDMGGEGAAICTHQPAYPRGLSEHALAPRALSVRGGIDRFRDLLERDVVAIVGTRRATDYGIESARELARALAASGLIVASALGEGIGSAAHLGAMEGNGRTLTVMAGGVQKCSPAWCGGLYRRILERGCAISELVDRSSPRPRRWWGAACARTIALLSQLVIVVEAEDHPWELACARVAQAHETPIAALPGRVSSPASAGSNALLVAGARLVRGPKDALDALYGVGVREVSGHPTKGSERASKLDPRLTAVLEMVGNGHNTPARLAARGHDPGDIALALIELELQGLVVRGDGGRYLPSSLSGAARRVRTTAAR